MFIDNYVAVESNSTFAGKHTPPALPVEVSFCMSPELNQRLQQIATARSIPFSEVMARAFMLLDLTFEAVSNSHRVGIIDSNEKLITEFVGI